MTQITPQQAGGVNVVAFLDMLGWGQATGSTNTSLRTCWRCTERPAGRWRRDRAREHHENHRRDFHGGCSGARDC